MEIIDAKINAKWGRKFVGIVINQGKVHTHPLPPKFNNIVGISTHSYAFLFFMIALPFERECNWPEFCEDSRDDRSQPRSNGMRLFESAFPPQSPQSHCHWNVVWLGYFALTSECIDCTPFLMWVWSGHSIPTWNLSYNRILIALIDLKNFVLLLFCICLSFRIKCCHFHPNLVASMSLYILSMDTLKVYKGIWLVIHSHLTSNSLPLSLSLANSLGKALSLCSPPLPCFQIRVLSPLELVGTLYAH